MKVRLPLRFGVAVVVVVGEIKIRRDSIGTRATARPRERERERERESEEN